MTRRQFGEETVSGCAVENESSGQPPRVRLGDFKHVRARSREQCHVAGTQYPRSGSSDGLDVNLTALDEMDGTDVVRLRPLGGWLGNHLDDFLPRKTNRA